MSDALLDLDALAPQPKQVKVSGKIIECKPPTIRQLLNIQKTVDKIQQSSTTAEEAITLLEDAFASIMPAIKEDPDIDLTLEQFYALIQFLQSQSIPDSATKAQSYPVQKKTDSPEQ